MLYDLELGIEYEYDAPSDGARNLLHLLPLTLVGRQTLQQGVITCDPAPDERRDRLDFFGNPVTEVSWHSPLQEIRIHLRARVERLVTAAAPMDLSPGLPDLARELAGLNDIGPRSPHHFLAPSPRVAPNAAMAAYARDHVKPGATALEVVLALGKALHGDMTFDAEATDVDTPPATAFAQRRGVCQDFTHVMIACLRSLGIPAGYVSGCLRTLPPPGQERLAGADAMHAWVRAWTGHEGGWIEFDPTNDLIVGRDHITVAYGRDYADVAPVKGVLRTAGGQESSHSVDVIPVKTAA
ncbi:transglutaminase family protein [Pseudooceanicola nanhaiensis]|uniref:transglutaminase family protein n=1 Tax=Pseudooceanicola nanhaiensis TaxID=375761 RepID=UPI001CD34AE5|nr:transglutaminase family protein [Pseudooceanicola nanhaiensis]MCA0918914.1 transglutaminase family protein [Pseudooceanicola nanhaiensis]